MKITDVNVWKENLELTRPYSIAYREVTDTECVFVEITGEHGLTGIGSANPSEKVVGESVEDTYRILDLDGADWLIGKDLGEFYAILEELQQRFPSNPGVRAALDIALHDLFTESMDVPLVKFLGQKITALPTSVTIGIKDVEGTLADGEEFLGLGFKILKVKLGKDLDEDIERLIKLRERFGDNVGIRVDANQGYSVDDLMKFVDKTRHLELELIEQPMPYEALEEMKGLPSEIKADIAADESLKSPSDAFHLAEQPIAAGIFNIKLMKTGGIYGAKKIADIADHARIDLMWGCNDESIVSITAALHTAFSCSRTKFLDLDGSFDLARDVVEGGFVLKDGYMSVTDVPGLGVKRIN